MSEIGALNAFYFHATSATFCFPYGLCPSCVAAHFDHMKGTFPPEPLRQAGATILRTLGRSAQTLRDVLPPAMHDTFTNVALGCQEQHLLLHAGWLRQFLHFCAACGEWTPVPRLYDRSIVIGSPYGPPVAVMFTVCPACWELPGEALQSRLEPNLKQYAEKGPVIHAH